jgi:hypothetical protein
VADRPAQDEMLKSLLVSLAVCLPAFCLAVWLIEKPVAWTSPPLVVLCILGLTAANFATIIFLEYYRASIGRLTLPALLGAVAVVLLYMIAQSMDRFVHDIGYNWLFPAVACFLLLSACAIFRERQLLLKGYLALNTVAMAVLWGLGDMDRMTLPF